MFMAASDSAPCRRVLRKHRCLFPARWAPKSDPAKVGGTSAPDFRLQADLRLLAGDRTGPVLAGDHTAVGERALLAGGHPADAGHGRPLLRHLTRAARVDN